MLTFINLSLDSRKNLKNDHFFFFPHSIAIFRALITVNFILPFFSSNDFRFQFSVYFQEFKLSKTRVSNLFKLSESSVGVDTFF